MESMVIFSFNSHILWSVVLRLVGTWRWRWVTSFFVLLFGRGFFRFGFVATVFDAFWIVVLWIIRFTSRCITGCAWCGRWTITATATARCAWGRWWWAITRAGWSLFVNRTSYEMHYFNRFQHTHINFRYLPFLMLPFWLFATLLFVFGTLWSWHQFTFLLQ